MAVTIDDIQIEIEARATNAADRIDAINGALARLRGTVKGGAGLTTVSKQFERFSAAMNSMSDLSDKISKIVSAFGQLQSIGKSNLGSTLNQLKKIPDITAGLDNEKLSEFATKIQQVTDAVRPLATEMEKVSQGFSKLPANIQRAINANARLTTSNYRAQHSFFKLSNVMAKVYVVKRIAGVIGNWITESNDYVENLNLFTVAMGEYAESAKRYAETVQEALGIDASEFMRYQGVFMNMARGFGIVSDKAALMSKNLVQLGYDLASLYNVKFDVAMEKLESAISGQPRPMREWGFDLSEATLKAKALELGITANVEKMNQGQKAMIRYVQLLDTARKIGATGDFARTLETSANQLRILKAQATLAARALGNIFIPALNAVLPYAIAFLKVIRWVAQEIANLFGFKLPEIDYSGVSSLAGAGEDAADALDDATGSAKKLKNMLAGFDEINIIQQETGGGGAGGGGIGGDLGIALPEYDFLGGLLDNKVTQIFDDILGWAKRFLPILKKIAPLLAGLWAAKKLIQFADRIKHLSSLMGTSGLTGTLGKVASALTGLFVGTVIGSLVTYVSYLALADTGLEDVGAAVGFLVAALGMGVAAWGAFTGSVGLAFTGIGLVIGAIIGLTTAQEQLLTEKVSDWFYSYNEGSTTITQLAESYAAMADEIIAQKQPIIDGFAAFESAKQKVADTSTELNSLLQAAKNDSTQIPQLLPEITKAFEDLKNDTKETLDILKDNIYRSLAGATGEAYIAMGGDIELITKLLGDAFGEADKTLQSLYAQKDELYDQYNKGKITDTEFVSSLIDLQTQITGLTQDSSDALGEFAFVAQHAFDGIDFEEPKAVSEALGVFKTKTDEAKKALEDAAKAEYGELEAFKTMMENMGFALTPEQERQLDLWKETIDNKLMLDTAKIDEQFRTAASTISASLVANMQQIAQDAFAESGGDAAYVAKVLDNYRNTIVTPLQNQLIEANGSIGSEIAGKTDSIIDEILSALFEYKINGFGFYVSGFKKDIESAFKGPLEELGKSIPSGIGKAVTDNTSVITDATKGAMEKGMDAAGKAIGYGSPAREYMKFGLSEMQGVQRGVIDNAYLAIDANTQAARDSMGAFASGITDNANLVTSAFKSVLNDMLNLMERFTGKIATALNGMLGNFASTMRSMSISSGGAVSFTRMSGITIQGFAEGGFPVSGELFYAREGGAAEYVGSMGGRTAVASNDQIVSGIREGVADANREQNALLKKLISLQERALEQGSVVVFPTSVEAGRAVSRSIRMYETARGTV